MCNAGFKTRGGREGITMNDPILAAHVIELVKRYAFYGVVNMQFMFAGEVLPLILGLVVGIRLHKAGT